MGTPLLTLGLGSWSLGGQYQANISHVRGRDVCRSLDPKPSTSLKYLPRPMQVSIVCNPLERSGVKKCVWRIYHAPSFFN